MLSTEFTTDDRPEMTGSSTLQLVNACRGLQNRLAGALAAELEQRGYSGIGPTQLGFLAHLDCGPNHAAELARRSGVSRQAVHKTVRELAELGVLSLVDDPGLRNQKLILFTPGGERLIADCRKILAEMDERLTKELGTRAEDIAAALDRALAKDG
jgi:DNA-binding MarR family transcriptional regulator